MKAGYSKNMLIDRVPGNASIKTPLTLQSQSMDGGTCYGSDHQKHKNADVSKMSLSYMRNRDPDSSKFTQENDRETGLDGRAQRYAPPSSSKSQLISSKSAPSVLSMVSPPVLKS